MKAAPDRPPKALMFKKTGNHFKFRNKIIYRKIKITQRERR
jgi:hypothetical protein